MCHCLVVDKRNNRNSAGLKDNNMNVHIVTELLFFINVSVV